MRILACAVVVALLGCGSSGTTGDGGANDLSAGSGDGGSGDMASGPACNPNDPHTDGQDCASAACPSGTVAVSENGACKCYTSCSPSAPGTCPCSRRCAELFDGDGGSAGGACLPANGPGERCGQDGMGKPIGAGVCAQGLMCVSLSGGNAYCLYQCSGQGDCPAQTQCTQITNGSNQPIGLACAYLSGAMGKDVGTACVASDSCKTGSICDSTCRTQCDGPGAACAAGTCTKLEDTAKSKVTGYVCK